MIFKKYIFYAILINILNYIFIFIVANKYSVRDYGVFYSTVFLVSLVNQFLIMGFYEYWIKFGNKISKSVIIHIIILFIILFFVFLINICNKVNIFENILELIYANLNLIVLIFNCILIANANFSYVLKNSIFIGIIKIFAIDYINIFENNNILLYIIIYSELLNCICLLYKYLKIKNKLVFKDDLNIISYKFFFKNEIYPFFIIGTALYLFLSFDRVMLINFGDPVTLGGYLFTYQLFFSPFIVIGGQLTDFLMTVFVKNKYASKNLLTQIIFIIILNYLGVIIITFIMVMLFDLYSIKLIAEKKYLIREYILLFSFSACNVVNIKIINIFSIITGDMKKIANKISFGYLVGILTLFISYLNFNISGLIISLFISTFLMQLFCLFDIYLKIYKYK